MDEVCSPLSSVTGSVLSNSTTPPGTNVRENDGEEIERSTSRLMSHSSESKASLRESFTPRRSLQSVVAREFAFSMRGIENFHIYLWILKDFAWAQDDYWLSIVFGSAALAFCGLLLYQALPDVEEVYMYVALTLWLFGNYWWMSGEVGIHGDDDTNAPECAEILTAALCWLGLYYACLRPMGYITASSKMLQRYKQSGLKSRFTYFLTWRQYEYAHTFFWLCKDLSWNLLEPVPWVMFSIPTVLISCDFVYSTAKQGHIVDSAHYCAQLIWVWSNLVWAAGEMFTPQYDDPIPITTRTPTAYKTCRWWASILLVFAFVPISVLYLIWFPLKTCEGEGIRRRAMSLNISANSDDELLEDGVNKSPDGSSVDSPRAESGSLSPVMSTGRAGSTGKVAGRIGSSSFST